MTNTIIKQTTADTPLARRRGRPLGSTNAAKKAAMEAFLSFIRLLGCDVIADNVTNDEQINARVRADCIGYIPSPDYKGTADHGRLRMPLDEVLLQSDDGQEEF